jgi:serine phosphatase RsbU (regulator of sigma subunit)
VSLRTRLIIAFLLLSVVPLTAVTLFSYTSWVDAFEDAARREASESAEDISRRMEFVTRDVGRRMDRLFDETTDTDLAAAGEMRDDVRDRVAPMLGETAALVERLEFHPASEAEGTGGAGTPAPPRAAEGGRAPTAPPPPPPAPSAGAVPSAPAVPPVPPAPQVIVMDVPRIMEEARRAARMEIAKSNPDLAPLIDKSMALALPAAEAGLAAVGAMLANPNVPAPLRDMQLHIDGRRVEIAVKKGGKVVGTANATLNMDRTLKTVLTFARRDEGEIPFALDQRGGIHTPDDAQKPVLDSLNISARAQVAAEGSPQRAGDWLVVARKDPGGLIFGIARPIGESLREIRRASVRNLSLGLLAIGLALVGIVPISHRMTRHLTSLTTGVRQLAGGDFHTRVPVRGRDEFGVLAAAFNQMAEDLERNQSLVVEQERLRRELELSRQIQTEMLPRARLRLGPAEIRGVSIPAREVGGDFFNYFQLPDGRLALLVGDVSGKGVSAALLMANVQATLRARLPLETDLAKLASDLDREIDERTPRGVYLTLFLAILETDGRMLRYINAGHNPQFVIRARGGIHAMTSTGLPIALYPDHGYTEASVTIDPGDLLFFYTDGLVEAENVLGDQFGAERLQEVIAAEQSQGIDVVLERVDAAVRAFRGQVEPLDDETMMALRLDKA